MDKKYMTTELTDAELDSVAVGQDTNIAILNGSEVNFTFDNSVIIDISDSEDSIVINTASQDLIIGNTAFNFDDSVFHMEIIGFNGAGVDGGHVITFQGGANDVAVAEHDGHTTLSWAGGDCTLTVDAVDLTEGTDWLFA